MKIFIMKMYILSAVFTCLSITAVFSQKKQLKKANKSYEAYAYIEAQVIYLDVIKAGYSSADIYQKLGDTYYWNSDYNNASKWFLKSIEEYPGETAPTYYYRASQSLKSLGKYEASDALMETYASSGHKNHIIDNFIKHKKYLNEITNLTEDYNISKSHINTNLSDYGVSFYNDKIIFTSSGHGSVGDRKSTWNEEPYTDLYMADKDSLGHLSNVVPFSETINTELHESTPIFSKDGKTVYFTRSNFLEGKKIKGKKNTIYLKMYKAELASDGSWFNIQKLPFNKKNYSIAHPALNTDESKLYFASNMPGTFGMSDLWYVDILGDNKYGDPVNLGDVINSEGRESFPVIDDANTLYFSTDGRPGLGGYDIFKTTLNSSGNISEIKPLGKPVNSTYDDFSFVMDRSKSFGYLSSNRRDGKKVESDNIYILKEKKAQFQIKVETLGTITEELMTNAEISLLDANSKVVSSVNSSTGSEEFLVTEGEQYVIRVNKQEYGVNEMRVVFDKESANETLKIKIKRLDGCASNDLGCILKLEPIYFDLDKFSIRKEAVYKLDKVLGALRSYPRLNIEIQSYTDSRATKKYNIKLSNKRAKSTYKWLIDKGVKSNRLTYKGYGETQLINKCSDGVRCAEDQHKLNRRSIFIVKD